MPIGYSASVDELFGMVQAVWESAPEYLGYTPEMRWYGSKYPTKPPVNQVWARTSIQIVKDSIAALANNSGVRKYTAYGVLYIQMFCPQTDADMTNARLLAEVVRNYFRKESTSGAIWFTEQRIKELVPDGETYFPVLIAINFRYDTLSDEATTPPFSTYSIRPGIPMSAQRNLPVEAMDGTRTTFTFVGLPANQNLYVCIWNGLEMNNLPQSGDQLTLPAAPASSDSLYVWF